MANHQQLGSKKGSSGGGGGGGGAGWRAAVIEMACSRIRRKENKEEEIKAPMSNQIHSAEVS